MGGPTGAREIGPHRGGGGKREKAISPGRGGAEEEIVNAHLSLGLEIIPIVHRNYDGWTIRWSLPARRPTWDHEFESDFLQRRVCELSTRCGGVRTLPRWGVSTGGKTPRLWCNGSSSCCPAPQSPRRSLSARYINPKNIGPLENALRRRLDNSTGRAFVVEGVS